MLKIQHWWNFRPLCLFSQKRFPRWSFCKEIAVKLSRIVGCLAVLFLVAALGYSQVSTSRLEGTIEDESGAVIPGGKVEAVNVKTGIATQVGSDAAGRYI